MRTLHFAALLLVVTVLVPVARAQDTATPRSTTAYPPIEPIDPPEKGFFTKVLSFHGVPIKASAVVSNEALHAAYDRLSLLYSNLMTKQPWVISNQAGSGCEFHIIGRNQVTTDLPEYLQDKHVPLDEYNGLTRDQRTRGMGGRLTSFGEENLLQLTNDRYRGRDICLHESSHSIMNYGCLPAVKARFAEQRQKSLDKGLWVNSYAGSNPDEYFAELTMWYFGTHGDLTMTGTKPENGPEGLKKYDPDAYALIDEFWSGRIQVDKVERGVRPTGGGTNAGGARGARGGTNTAGGFRPRDSQMARAIVAHLSAYKVGETKLTDFYEHAGMAAPEDSGTNGWFVTKLEPEPPAEGACKFRVEFRAPQSTAPRVEPVPAAGGTNTQTNATGRAGGRGGRGANARSRGSIAEFEFRNGVMSAFKWNN